MEQSPKILASAVIRSNVRKRYDGGLYLVDLNNQTFEQVLNWNIKNVTWKESLGDIGTRGMSFWNNLLYCCSGDEILVFDKSFSLVKRFGHPLIAGTHECCIYEDRLYIISNQLDSILVFDLKEEKFTFGYQFLLRNQQIITFEPDKYTPERSDLIHIDSISIKDDYFWISGSQFRYLIGFPLKGGEVKFSPILYTGKHGGSHNLQWWGNYLVYNLASRGETCCQISGETHIWKTPLTQDIVWSISSDYAAAQYTRGMVLTKNYVIAGSSPARVDVYDLDHKEPLISVEISKDIRNSICCMTKYEW
jgi:hypothetical protein